LEQCPECRVVDLDLARVVKVQAPGEALDEDYVRDGRLRDLQDAVLAAQQRAAAISSALAAHVPAEIRGPSPSSQSPAMILED
jgi:hypothetical protein